MSLAAVETAEDWANPSEDWSTSDKRPINPVKVASDQATLAFMQENVIAPTVERPGGGNGERLPKLTELGQNRQRVVRVREWPVVRDERPETPTFYALQEWEGHVVSINETEFTARLVDLTDRRSFEEEEAQIPLEEISESVAAKMKVGSIFRWVVGYKHWAMGQKERVSSIVFRDLPAVSRSDRRAGDRWAEQVLAAFRE